MTLRISGMPDIDEHGHNKEGTAPMSILAYILLSLSTVLFSLGAYLWYVTPSPEDLAEEVLSRRERNRKISAAAFRASKPQRSLTHINCLS